MTSIVGQETAADDASHALQMSSDNTIVNFKRDFEHAAAYE